MTEASFGGAHLASISNGNEDSAAQRRRISDRYFAGRPLQQFILVTLGGFDHPLTDGLVRFVKALAAAAGQGRGQQVLLAGRVVQSQHAFWEKHFHGTPAYARGDIQFAGLLNHDDHLSALRASDMVITQPGYSTLCELVALQKPVILVYGFYAYYEQYANFVGAAEAGLCLTRQTSRPDLQTGAYHIFGSNGPVSQRELNRTLAQLLNSGEAAIGRIGENQRRALNRHPVEALTAVNELCRGLRKAHPSTPVRSDVATTVTSPERESMSPRRPGLASAMIEISRREDG